MADQKYQERKFLHNLKVFEVEENGFIDNNFQFFTIANFPISQDGGPKKQQEGKFLHYLGIFEVKENVFIDEYFHFSL